MSARELDRSSYHTPVLAREVVELLQNAKTVLDGTLGGGGHSGALLESGVPRVIGIDRDPDALASARVRLESQERGRRFSAVAGNYSGAAEFLPDTRFDGVLLDLGVSSRQFDAAERGFTFREGAPLDMRMNVDDAATAADLLNDSDERELARAF